MLMSFLQRLIDSVSYLLQLLPSFLPDSPFIAVMNLSLSNDYLRWLSWIIPFPQIVAILQSWGVAIVVYYSYMVLLRFVKAIE